MTVWQPIAAREGGTVAGLVGVPGPGGVSSLFAATATGIFRSDDGRAWAPTSSGASVPFATAIAASPHFADDGTLFAAARDGLYRSRDGGTTWARVLIGGPIFAVALSPTFAEDGALFVATAVDGVLRSEDGGASWSGANAGLLDLTVLALALSPRVADDRTAFAGTASGLYRSRNGGRSWREVNLGLDEPGVQALAISPGFARDRLVLAGTEADGLLRSDDAGTTWDVVDALAGRGVTAIALASRPGAPPLIAAAAEDAVLLSEDGGEEWRETEPLPAPALALEFAAQASREPTLFVGLAGRGVARLGSDGRTWEAANEGLLATPLAMLVASPDFGRDRTLFAASSEGVVLVSRDGGASWAEWDVALDEPAVTAVVVSPRFTDDGTAWVAAVDRLYRSRDRGDTWQPLPFLVPAASGAAEGQQVVPDRSRSGAADYGMADPNGSPALRSLAAALPDGDRPAILFAGRAAGEVLRSNDGGESWRSLGSITGGGELVSLVASPSFKTDRALLAVATGAVGPSGEGGLILWRSTDGGAHWERWLDAPGVGLLSLAVPTAHWRDGALFVGAGRSVLVPIPNTRERRGGVSRPLWHATDLGPEVAAIVALATPSGGEAGRTLFAATNVGIFVSRDGGRSFAPWSDGLDPTATVALAVSPDYETDRLVFAVGLGGTIWRREDTQ
ncbi:MAG: hypothetical protein M3O34_15335 [Chloroflexota bacterium]|nr:hypothetical protein [Chloroflexota bacterium]